MARNGSLKRFKSQFKSQSRLGFAHKYWSSTALSAQTGYIMLWYM